MVFLIQELDRHAGSIQAIAAVISIFVTGIFAYLATVIAKKQKEISENLFLKENRRRDEITKKISVLMVNKLNALEDALHAVTINQAEKIVAYSFVVELSEEMLLEYLDVDTYSLYKKFWKSIEEYQSNFFLTMDGTITIVILSDAVSKAVDYSVTLKRLKEMFKEKAR